MTRERAVARRIGWTGFSDRFQWAKERPTRSATDDPRVRYRCTRNGHRFRSAGPVGSCLMCGGPVEGLGAAEEQR